MHIEAYEWALYLSGRLSERRMSEMEAHLKECDACLETYAALASGEGAKPARFRFLQPLTRGRRPVFGAIAAVCVVFLIFLSTPTGKIVWAELTQSLREWFAVKAHPELIETIDVPAVSHHGIEMKLGEVLIEDNRVYFSVHATIDSESPIRSIGFNSMQDSLTIGDVSFDVVEEWRNYSLNSTYVPHVKDSQSMIVFRSDIPLKFLHDDAISMRLAIDYIQVRVNNSYETLYGPWQFDFIVDGSKAKELTRTVALDYSFKDNQSEYVVTDFVFSPIRVKIRVQRMMPKEKKVIKIYKWQTSYADPRGNLAGFIIEDDQGNRVEIARAENNDFTSDHGKMESFFYSDGNNNGWEWLKDAESVTLTPYIVTLAGIENEAEGIDRFHALESFEIELK